MLNKLRHSFSARLNFFILLFTVAIFVSAFAAFYHFSHRTIVENAREMSENTLQIINLQIENVLRQVEAVPNSLNWIITKEEISPDSMYSITQNIVRNNPYIYGSAIAFEPYYFKAKGYYFSPYSFRDGDTISSLQLGNDDYDYFSWRWYSEPKKTEQPSWSEPYYDKGGGQKIMCTYSSPIFDPNNKIIGIFTSDISLDWLSDLAHKMKKTEHTGIFMLDKDGTFIIYNQRDRILNQTIFDLADEFQNPQFGLLGNNMIAGHKGMLLIKNNKENSFVFYTPVPNTHWSLGIIMPTHEVFSDLRQINMIMFVIFGLGLLALFVICFRIVNNLTTPLKSFADSARKIAHGNFDVKLPAIQSEDEMKELFDSFTYMQSELNNYITDLQQTTTAKEKIESELRIARGIQISMLPKVFPPFPNHKEIDLFAALNPAKEVSGDLYDFFMVGDNLFFIIGDVSGKGVPASLLMASTLTLFRSVTERIETPVAIVNSLNDTLSENNTSNMFVTLLVGTLDIKTGLLIFCNAGHNPPVIVSQEEECKWLKTIPNLPVGVMKGFKYIEQSITLPDLSCLFLYTDGATEAENTEKKLYGEKRLMEIVRKNAKNTPYQIITNMLCDIHEYVDGNDPSDDITLLCFKRTLMTIPLTNNHLFENKLIISNNIVELGKVSEFIKHIGTHFQLKSDLVMNLNLAMEEAVANIILYGFKSKNLEKKLDSGLFEKEKEKCGEIEISFWVEEDNLVFMIVDEGEEFDITLSNTPDITLSAEERPIGGLGIFLIRKIMDEILYRRENGKNILTISKKILT